MPEDDPKPARRLHPKSIRRKVLQELYRRYLNDPLEMVEPSAFGDLLENRRDLMANMHYLSDRKLVEMMMGYNPPMFAALRITADGIDLVENRFEFNLRFPPDPGEEEETGAGLSRLVEQLVEEADFCSLDGEARQCLLRDVQYLRDEVSRPVHRWRRHVIYAILYWLEEPFPVAEEGLPSLRATREAVDRNLE